MAMTQTTLRGPNERMSDLREGDPQAAHHNASGTNRYQQHNCLHWRAHKACACIGHTRRTPKKRHHPPPPQYACGKRRNRAARKPRRMRTSGEVACGSRLRLAMLGPSRRRALGLFGGGACPAMPTSSRVFQNFDTSNFVPPPK